MTQNFAQIKTFLQAAPTFTNRRFFTKTYKIHFSFYPVKLKLRSLYLGNTWNRSCTEEFTRRALDDVHLPQSIALDEFSVVIGMREEHLATCLTGSAWVRSLEIYMKSIHNSIQYEYHIDRILFEYFIHMNVDHVTLSVTLGIDVYMLLEGYSHIIVLNWYWNSILTWVPMG